MRTSWIVGWVCVSAVHVCQAMPTGPAYEVAWMRQFGTNQEDFAGAATVDSLGNAYVTGWTYGTLAGTQAGNYDVFLRKYDTAGNVLWTRQWGSTQQDQGRSVAVDALGNAYVSGCTYGALATANAGFYDGFLTKFDAGGNLLWSQQLGTSAQDFSHGMALDPSGNAYVSGYTEGSLGATSIGAYDAFIRKYDPAGGTVWTRQFGSTAYEYCEGIAVDSAGSAYVTGHTGGSLAVPHSGNPDRFVRKYDAAGNVLWTKQAGLTQRNEGNAVAVNTAGAASVAGWIDTSPGEPQGPSGDALVTRFDAAGNELWTRQWGTSDGDYATSAFVDPMGNTYVCGETFGALGGVYAGDRDVFLSKFDATGNLVWSKQFGSATRDDGESITMDGAGNLYLCGHTYGALAGVSSGQDDIYLIKLSPVPEPNTLSALGLGAFTTAVLYCLRRRRRASAAAQ